ncbi:RHS repeat protein [Salmonella enterica subsp. salamae]|nr:RHS repeat protein [Salmonella enterica subsp. salamae]
MRISGPQQTREYRYSEAGRLTGVHTTAANLDITLPYATDPAGNRLPDPEFYPQSSSMVWADNRITEDMQYRYRYDRYGRLTEKTDRIPEGVIRMHDERTHRYDYDNQHRLVRYVRTQYGETQAEGRYVYDPTGRRVGKRVWKREPVHWSETRTELSARPYETWYGWEGDRLTTVQTQQRRVQTVYAPGSFTPLLRVETENTELAKTRHRGLPLALISPDNTVAWRAEYDEWGNQLSEDNPAQLEQLIRLPGQQYDEESGLYYNRHRYYNPGQGRYITQDPAGLEGGWNPYTYPLNPVMNIDPLGLWQDDSMEQSGPSWFIADPMEKYRQQAAIDLTKWWHDTAPQRDLFLLTQCPEARMIMLAAMNGSTSSTNARQSEYEAYKNRCNQSPPPNLDFCSLAKWKLSRNKDCRDMRQSWDNKWLPGRHAKNIAELDVGINKLAKTIADKCP